jgi:hypothetical protein
MSQPVKSWNLLGLISVVCLTVGYVLHHPEKKGGDILDALAAVERGYSLYLVPERGQPPNRATEGGFYLCRTSKTPEELDRLIKDPRDYNERWQGIVYFKACARRHRLFLPFLPGPDDKVLDYGGFAVYGDPELIQIVCSILTDEGFETTRALQPRPDGE